MALVFPLLSGIGKIVLNCVGVGQISEVLVEVAGAVLNEWSGRHEANERQAELERLARATADEVRAQVAEIVAELAHDRTPGEQARLTGYLTQVPAMVRRTLRRPSDPSGSTILPQLMPQQADDLLALLPPAWPRFESGASPPGLSNRVLLELLGMGGFGEVWKASNPQVSGLKPVALKFALHASDREALLHHEAAVLARVQEQDDIPGVVRLLDTYLHLDTPGLEYEYVAGGDFTALVREERAQLPVSQHEQADGIGLATGPLLPPARVADWIRELTRTVAHFHHLQPAIVHRDLKPANILVQPLANGGRRLKIADFGIGGIVAARVLAQTRQAPRSAQLTLLRGAYSPLYASPEQERGLPADPRDDVHALGVLWFQLLQGDWTRGAPRGQGWAQRLRQRGMEPAIITLLASCFEDDPADRPRDAGSLLDALDRLDKTAATLPPAATTPRPATPAEPVSHSGTGLPSDPKATTLPREKLLVEMVAITPGEFTMGVSTNERANVEDRVPHRVRLTRPFLLARYPVTQTQYNQVMGNNPSYYSPRGGGKQKLGHEAENVSATRPVESVTWFDAVLFCNRLSVQEQLPVFYEIAGEHAAILGGIGYRLPTEAEWEYACRAGSTTCWHFGDRVADLPRYAWFSRNAGGKTHPVGQLSPNAWQLYDMLGNVWEWCWDSYAPYVGSFQIDPTGPTLATTNSTMVETSEQIPGDRVMRGGSWNAPNRSVTSANRSRGWPSHSFGATGFRVCRFTSF